MPYIAQLRLPALAVAVALLGCSGNNRSAPTPNDDAADSARAPQRPAGELGYDQVPQYQSIAVDANGFLIDGQYRLLRGGTLQWFRLPEEVWEDRLRRFKAAGFNTVDIYVPWNVIEPREGEFNFEQPNLRHFLTLAQKHGLYVYFRPGPYITNEMDGGGLPAWLVPHTTKKSREADGRPNLRVDDPDYLAASERYLRALNEHIRPFLITNGGPIILYAIENEYDWFEIFFQVDKLFWYGGGPERSLTQGTNTRQYMAALRDIALNSGIDVPITTCPGSAKVAGTGDVDGVIPMPNIYKSEGIEKIAYDIVTSMHDPQRFGGNYTGFPSGSTETERTVARMKRLFSGGLDGFFAFNVVGMHTPGYQNSVVLNNAGPKAVFDLSVDAALNAFVAPEVAYFHNVIDYYGAISASGTLREKFWSFRRANLFYDAFEDAIGGVLHPLRSGDFRGADARLQVRHPLLGAEEGNRRVHYWMQAADGTRFVGLTNTTGTAQTVPLGSIELEGRTLPRYEPMTVVAETIPGPDTPSSEAIYQHLLVADLPLAADTRLSYTTSEILTWRQFGDKRLLVLYGPAGASGELAIDGAVEMTPADGFTAHDGQSDLELSYTYGAPAHLQLRVGAERIDVLVVSTELAGRSWFFRTANDAPMLIAGADYAAPSLVPGKLVDIEDTRNAPELLVMSTESVTLDGYELSEPWDATAGLGHFRRAAAAAPAAFDIALAQGRSTVDAPPTASSVDDQWQALEGQPMPLELLDILEGHAWYVTEVELDDPARHGNLYIEHASDIVGIYVNGTYITTVSPLGTEIDNRSWTATYRFPDLTPHLRAGKNVLAFRVEVWGHGSFMWPRGTLIGSRAKLPSLGFDAFKGLWGRARLGNTSLNRWWVRGELEGERQAVMAPSYDDSGWQPAAVPLALGKGDVRWYRTTFATDALPDPSEVFAPAVLALAGARTKATIFVNGTLIGRWLSDETWLQRGSWVRPLRAMWMVLSPDHFPIPVETLTTDGSPNVLAVAFEDASGPEEQAGVIERIALQPAAEERAPVANPAQPLVSRPMHRDVLKLSY